MSDGGQHKKRIKGVTRGPLRALLSVVCCLILACAVISCGSSSGGGGDNGTNVTGSGAVSAPENVAITASDGSATITWDDVAGATSYNVYWKNEPDVSKTLYDGILPEDASPCIHTGLINGEVYYYVVTAVNAGGESDASYLVGAIPKLPGSDIPQYVSARATPDTTNSLTITWADVSGAASYNLYWDIIPGVTKATGNRIENATSPYVHTERLGRTTYYYVVTSLDALSAESDESAEVSATARGPKVPRGGHDETGFGNNLSMPVVFANGYGMTGESIAGIQPMYLDHGTGLRPTASDIVHLDSLGETFPYFDAESTISIGGVTYYPQMTASMWQAEWEDGSGSLQSVIADWGDNLASGMLRTTMVIRVETVLYQDGSVGTPAVSMLAYNMQSLYGSHENEIFGTDMSTYASSYRSVFAPNARLRIEKLVVQGGPVDAGVTSFENSIYESFGIEGPGGYVAEINGKGSIVYGYNWMINQWPDTQAEKTGWWRLTFSLDTDCMGLIDPCDNTIIVDSNATGINGGFGDKFSVVEVFIPQ